MGWHGTILSPFSYPLALHATPQCIYIHLVLLSLSRSIYPLRVCFSSSFDFKPCGGLTPSSATRIFTITDWSIYTAFRLLYDIKKNLNVAPNAMMLPFVIKGKIQAQTLVAFHVYISFTYTYPHSPVQFAFIIALQFVFQ